VNGGQPIDQGQPPDQLSTNALDAQDYETIGVKTGFNQTLDENLHGNVHV
jgi:hypothetical protein